MRNPNPYPVGIFFVVRPAWRTPARSAKKWLELVRPDRLQALRFKLTLCHSIYRWIDAKDCLRTAWGGC
jgi:hypothetical protein